MATPEDILTKKIQRVYSQAAVEVKRKTEEFWSAHRRIAAQMLADVAAGKITQADYKKWLRGQVFTGERWKQKLDDITKVYVDADKKAREIIGGTTKNVFVDVANHTAYDMEKELRGGVSFDLYDGKTVERLLKDNPKMLPEWKIDEPKDYVWNEKRVQNAVTQGIVQGKSIADIGKRLTSELATSNGAKMDMFARTAVTGAQNAGRKERLVEAEEMGIEVKKQWIATHDQRVRDTHAYLDGQIVGVDEPFTVDGMKIDYPGDPLAPPELVYNCRCTLAYIYPKYQNQKRWEDQTTGEELPWKTFTEWKAAKQGQQEEREEKQEKTFAKQIEFTDVFTSEQQKSVQNALKTAENDYPLPYEFDFVGDGRIPRNLPHESLWDLRDDYPERRIDFGEAAQYISIKKDGGKLERRIDIIDDGMSATPLSEMYDALYKSHKRFDDEPNLSNALFNAGVGMEGTILHEYGHAVQDYCGFFIRETAEGRDFDDWLRGFAKAHPMDILSISRYAGESVVKDGTVNPSELWAEAFVTSFDPHHDTTAWKIANTIMQEFNKRFGHLFKKGR